MREKYESLPLVELKAVAKARGLKGLSAMKKDEVIAAMLQEDKREQQEKEAKEIAVSPEVAHLDSGITVSGILEVMGDGFGFIRSANYLPGENDIYVAPAQIRRFGLKTGDIITGNTKIKSEKEKFSALLYLTAINDMRPAEAMKRKNFEDVAMTELLQGSLMEKDRLYMERVEIAKSLKSDSKLKSIQQRTNVLNEYAKEKNEIPNLLIRLFPVVNQYEWVGEYRKSYLGALFNVDIQGQSKMKDKKGAEVKNPKEAKKSVDNGPKRNLPPEKRYIKAAGNSA